MFNLKYKLKKIINKFLHIIDAALSVGNTEDQFVKETRVFFQLAKNRIKMRNNYKNKTQTTQK